MQVLTKNTRIGIVGLGYAGLPLTIEFGKHYPTLGFDINRCFVTELKEGEERTLEVGSDKLYAPQYKVDKGLKEVMTWYTSQYNQAEVR